MKNLPRPLQI